MADLSAARCFHHPNREAVVRCTSCGRFYCRECVTEHHDRFLCGDCLAADARKAADRGKGRRAAALMRAVAGFLFLWVVFYYLGRGLLLIPTSFHDGTAWRSEGER